VVSEIDKDTLNNQLPDDTVLYKYLNVESYLYLLQYQAINVSRIIDWPDYYEGLRFDFFKRAHPELELDLATNKLEDFFVSCWSLQEEDRRIYDSDKEFDEANAELDKHGSAPMWESYCPNGGVRIKTTIAKLKQCFNSSFPEYKIIHGKVYYESRNTWTKTTNTTNILSNSLFHKMIPFRYESEYRYIVVNNKQNNSGIKFKLQVENLLEFIDGILVSPAMAKKSWPSKTLYDMSVNLTRGSNYKNGERYCFISQLYDRISENIGEN